MITINKIEKMFNKQYTDFEQITLAVKTRDLVYPAGYHNSYVFVNNTTYFYQLPDLNKDNGRRIDKKSQFNDRIKYLTDCGFAFEELVMIDNSELLVKFKK